MKAGRGPAARLGRLLGAGASFLLLALLALAAGLWLRLAAGPIDLSPAIPFVERAAAARLPGGRLEIGALRLRLADDPERGRAVRLVAEEIALFEAEVGKVASVPAASARFALAALIEGRVAPTEVTLSGVSARLERDASGAFRFGFEGASDAAAAEGAEAFRRLLAEAAASEEGAGGAGAPPEGALRLEGASLLYLDRTGPRAYRAAGVTAEFRATAAGVTGRASLALDGGAQGRATASFEGLRAPDGRVTLEARFGNAAPADLAGQISALDWLSALDAPVSGRIALGMDGAGALDALEGRIEAGAGGVTLAPGVREPFRAAAFDFVFEPAAQRFAIGEVALDADRAGFRGAGFVQVGRDAAGAPLDAVAQLDFADIRVAAPEFLDAPLGYRAGRLTGRVTLDPLTVEIGELRLERERMTVSAAGRLTPEAGRWTADMTVSAADFTLAEMLEHWPRQAAPGALLWMRENMEAARIVEADAALRLGGADEAVKIDFSFEDAVGWYLRPMPPIRGGRGAGQVDLQRFSLALDAGTATPEGGEPLDLTGSSFVIADLDHPDTPGEATIRATGRIMDALALIDSEPLALTSKLGVPLGEVAGRAAIVAVATLPLLKDLLLEDVAAAATAALTDVALVAPGLDREAKAAALTLEADTAGFRLAGAVEVAGLPAEIEWRERFSPPERAITAKASATPEALAAFGVTQGWFAGGSAEVEATLSPSAERTAFTLAADLAAADLAIPELGWTKAAGPAARLSAEGALAGRALTLRRFDLRAPDLSAAGRAATDADGAPLSARLDRLRFRDAVDLALDARREGRTWFVVAEGPLLDLTGIEDLTGDALADSEAGRESGAAVTPFRIDAKIGALKVTEDYAFHEVDGFLRRTGRDEVVARGTARVGAGGGPATAFLRRGPEGGELRLRVEDAGRFLRDAEVFDDGSGGTLALDAAIARGAPFRLDGTVRVKDIVIHEDAKLERLLAGAELDELRAQMRGDGIVFDAMHAPFTYAEDRLTLNDATAKGPLIGVNLSGDYALDRDALDLRGVFTPLYRINSALGAIPVLGTILTGGDGGGVFAFTFAVTGPAEDPSVSVNPLSVLAPGILRKIFEGGAPADASVSLPTAGAPIDR